MINSNNRSAFTKLILFFFIVFISKGYSQNNADPGIGIVMNPPTLTQGSTGILTATVGNFGNDSIVENSLQVTISVGDNAEIVEIASGSDAHWTQLSLTTGNANTIQLTNTEGGFNAFDVANILLTIRGNVVGAANVILGNIVYITAQNPLLCGGCASPPLNGSQGNATNSNDVSISSFTVSCSDNATPPSLSVPADLTISLIDYNSNINTGFAVSESFNITITKSDVSAAGGCGDSFVITRTWTASDVCGNIATADQIIKVQDTAVVVFTGIQTDLCIYDDLDFDLFSLLEGDFQADPTLWSVVSGNTTINGSLFNPFELELGDYVFAYSDPNSECPSITQFTITLNGDCVVCGDADEVIISKAVTPNGDQWNEYFTVEGIEGCGFTVELQIYNRWGAKIYESKDYQNNWNGLAHSNSFGGSNQVPTGTYYYFVNLVDSGLKPFSGPIYVGTN
jgi:gliding motility-associated-like protein